MSIFQFYLQDKEKPIRLLEVGCGVGNFIFPLLQEKPDFFFYACDFSPRAVQFVKVGLLFSQFLNKLVI